ncbi:MAG: hypothetical protein U0575_12210 [Phycisphaerales bacterium]
MRRLTCAVLAMAAGGSALQAGGPNPNWSIARQWDEEILQAIRISTPRPPVHARNLYHLSAAMYDAWATYDSVPHGLFFFEKHTAANLDADRREAISYAAYRVLKARYVAGNGPNIPTIQANLDSLFAQLGYDKDITTTVGDTPAAIGNRVAAAVLAAGLADGSNEQGNYAPNNGYVPKNASMPFKIPGTVMSHPNNWQPLAFSFLVLQNGEIVGASVQAAICPHWNGVTPFAMNTYDRNPSNNLYFDQGGPPLMGSEAMRVNAQDMVSRSAQLDPRLPATLDISPGVYHNSPLGSYDQPGHGLNPVTNQPYPSNEVLAADYYRALAEFWADGPDSETPPGHWHVVANDTADTEGFTFQFAGEGAPLDRLEWDVKMYLTVAGANHDAAVTAWGMKGYYDSARPISFVRYMGQSGQCTDPQGPSFDTNGLPLVSGLTRLVEPADVAPGGELEDLVELVYEPFSGDPIGVNDHVGDMIVKSWLGGFSAGTTTGTITTGPLPGQIYRDDNGWHIGAFEVGVNDTPGAVNPGYTVPTLPKLSEARLDQIGRDTDEYVEISGPPGLSLDGLTFIVLGDEVQTGVPDSQGRIQVAVDLSGHNIGPNGVFLIGRSTLSLATPDLEYLLNLKEIGNTTYALVAGFFGYVGQECDYLDDGVLDIEPWAIVLDSVAMRRGPGAAGIYFGSPVLGPDSSKNQTYGVDWVLADRWMTYQASNFVTPPFPGYTSGHSTFSRSSAEAMTLLTGSEYFPGGLGEFVVPAAWLKFEKGPSAPITLQWASYFDAADEAGVSRIWGGIHPMADDLPGRITGDKVGKRAFARAQALFEGLAKSPDLNGDGVVDGADLGLFVSEWGNSGGPGDINGDGMVDGADMGILLSKWG